MRTSRKSHGRSPYPSDPRPQKGLRPGASSWCLRSTTPGHPSNFCIVLIIHRRRLGYIRTLCKLTATHFIYAWGARSGESSVVGFAIELGIWVWVCLPRKNSFGHCTEKNKSFGKTRPEPNKTPQTNNPDPETH